MEKDKFVAYCAFDNETATFKTFDEAEKWLKEYEEDQIDEGYSEEDINGENYIAVITHRSKFNVTDSISNYTKEEIEDEVWPYNCDEIGTLDMVAI